MQGSPQRVFPGCPGEDHGDLSTGWESLEARVWSMREALGSAAFTSCPLGGCESTGELVRTQAGPCPADRDHPDPELPVCHIQEDGHPPFLCLQTKADQGNPGGPAAATSLHSSRKFDNQTPQSTWPSVDTTWVVLYSN